jgi:signal peptidase
MNLLEIIAAVATSIGVISFAAMFTLLYRSYSTSSIRELKTGKRDIELMDEYIYDSNPSVQMRQRVWGIVKNVCFYGILALLIPVFALSMINKFQGNVTMVGSHSLMVVASGSMSEKNSANDYLEENGLDNQFNTYDLIVLEQVNESDLKLYDVIAFVDDTGRNVIHRIVGFGADGSFITRGDANNTDDLFHPTFENVIGRYADKRVPALGSLVMFLQSVGGVVTLLSLVYCILMLERFNSKMRKEEEARLQQLCSAIELDLEQSEDEHAMRADFVETLYYKGFVYLFNEQGFVGKEEITDENYLEKSNFAAIRVKNANGERLEEEIIIETEREDEEQS